MVPRSFLALAVGIAAAIGLCLLLLAMSARDWRVPDGEPHSVFASLPRCYALAIQIPDAAYQDTSVVRLEAAPHPHAEATGWFLALRRRAKAGRGAASDTVAWRPAGADSVDLRLLGWPLSVHLRLPHAPALVHGRALLNGDVAYTPATVGYVDAQVQACSHYSTG